MSSEDRTYLVQLVSATTGLIGPRCERRMDAAIANAQTAIARSRRSSVILAFSVAAALLVEPLLGWAAAYIGGRHRDGEPMPRWLGSKGMVSGRSRGLA